MYQEYKGSFFKMGPILMSMSMNFPDPYRSIRRILAREDGSFAAVDISGEFIALLPIESVLILHRDYGVSLGEQARSKLEAFCENQSFPEQF